MQLSLSLSLSLSLCFCSYANLHITDLVVDIDEVSWSHVWARSRDTLNGAVQQTVG